MQNIEPNLVPLLWFALFASVASLSFYVLAGAFPIETRPDLKARPLALILVGVNLLLLAVTVGFSLVYGFGHLRWTSIVIVSGLACLFAPALFNIWPSRWRDGVEGLGIVFAALGAALATLQAIGSVFQI